MTQTELGGLHVEMLRLHRTEEEKTAPARAAEVEEFVEPRQGRHFVLNFDKTPVEQRIELGQRNIGEELLVEIGEGQPEMLPELVAGQGRLTELPEHVIRRADDRRQIIDQRAGPIEEEIAQHDQPKNLTERMVSGPNSAASLDSMSAFQTRSSSKRTLDWCTRT